MTRRTAPPIVNTEAGVVLIGGVPCEARRQRIDGTVYYREGTVWWIAERDVTRDSFTPRGGAA